MRGTRGSWGLADRGFPQGLRCRGGRLAGAVAVLGNESSGVEAESALERGDAQQGVDPPPSVEKPAPPLHERLLDYESEPHNRATGLFDDFSESLGGTAAREKIVYHHYPTTSPH